MHTAIQVNDIKKRYDLGSIGGSTLINEFKSIFKGNPERNQVVDTDAQYWALKGVTFDVKEGEVLGIIGKNGAGKSTLLKVLSRITSPTSGSIKIKGRVGSLLEVGTGFHPDLSGRDNIYMNGAILGMRKKEIDSKLDEIISFSGVSKYIDTPVKRYSSGMYVRLAFAVAAHLEPEILIIDEVLAVGDAEFQKKCLGKMQNVSEKGKTVLFVSHNMDAMRRICKNSILLEQGRITKEGTSAEVIEYYLNQGLESKCLYSKSWQSPHEPTADNIALNAAYFVDENNRPVENSDITKPLGICIEYTVQKEVLGFTTGINIFNAEQIHLISSHNFGLDYKNDIKPGHYKCTAWIPGNILAEGKISVNIALMRYNPFGVLMHLEDVLKIEIVDNLHPEGARGTYLGTFPGVVRPKLNWTNERL